MKQSMVIQIFDAVVVPPANGSCSKCEFEFEFTGCSRKVPSDENTNNNEDSNPTGNHFAATDDRRNTNKISFLFEHQQNMVSSDCYNRNVP